MSSAPALILASGSRFRRQMLTNAGVAFSVVTMPVDEAAARAEMRRDAPSLSPGTVAMRLAELKALEVSRHHPHALVIGADQVLAFEDAIFGKPDDEIAARAQLLLLRGHVHTLQTAVVLVHDGVVIWRHLDIAELEMRAFSAAFLDAYLRDAGGIITETVGGYALEGLGAQLFTRIDGDYFTVIGLPLIALLGELRRRGVLAD